MSEVICRCISIGGNEEQVELCKKEIQRMIGVTAGVGGEYKEQDAGSWNPIAQMKGLFSGAMDMNELNRFMQNSGFMGAAMGMPAMQTMPDMEMSQQPLMMPPMTQQPPMMPPQPPTNMPTHEEEEAPPGMDDEEEAPPGLLIVC